MFTFSFVIVYILLVIDSNIANKQAISFQGKKMKTKQNRQKHMDTRAYEFSYMEFARDLNVKLH